MEACLHVGAYVPVLVHRHHVASYAPIGVGVGVAVTHTDVAVHEWRDLDGYVFFIGSHPQADLRIQAVEAFLIVVGADVHAILVGSLLHEWLIIVAVAGEPLGTDVLRVHAERQLVGIERHCMEVRVAPTYLVDVYLLLHIT